MKFSVFSFIKIISVYCLFIFTLTLSCANSTQNIEQTVGTEQKFGIFAEILEEKRVNQTNLDITIRPITERIKARELDSPIGMESVLSIPVEIINSSSHSISMNLSHEWYGGIPPPTDFYVAAKEIDIKTNDSWQQESAYQVGNLGSVNGTTALEPGGKTSVDIRLNWRGTGSVPTSLLINGLRSGKYLIKFLLFFKTQNSEEYLATQEFKIEVES